MITLKRAMFAIIGLALAAGEARAQDASSWTVRGGPVFISPQESGRVSLGGANVAGGNVSIGGEWSVEGDVAYNLTRNLSLGVAAGLPPVFKIEGAGALAPVGRVGGMTGGPAGVGPQYHFNRGGAIQPYIGGGASFLIVFGTKDGALSHLAVRDAVGEFIQGGVDVMASRRWGVYLDLKKVWIGTTATGRYAGLPAVAKVNIDPLVSSFGVVYRF